MLKYLFGGNMRLKHVKNQYCIIFHPCMIETCVNVFLSILIHFKSCNKSDCFFHTYRTTTVCWSMPRPFCPCMRWVTARRRGCRRLTDCNRWGRLSTPCRRSSTLTPKPRTTAASSSMTVKGIHFCFLCI